jgi:hypothetical protein
MLTWHLLIDQERRPGSQLLQISPSRSRLCCTMQTANDSHILLAPKLVAQGYGRNEQATEWCWPYTLWLEELVNQD